MFEHRPLSVWKSGPIPSFLVHGFFDLSLWCWIGSDGGMTFGVHLLDIFRVNTSLNRHVKAFGLSILNVRRWILRSVFCKLLRFLPQADPYILLRDRQRCVFCGFQRGVDPHRNLGIALASVGYPNQRQQLPSIHRKFWLQLRFVLNRYRGSIGMRPEKWVSFTNIFFSPCRI